MAARLPRAGITHYVPHSCAWPREMIDAFVATVGATAKGADTFVLSTAYHALTGRKGLSFFANDNAGMIVCQHPNRPDRLLVFPEFGGNPDRVLTRQVLSALAGCRSTVQLARYSRPEIARISEECGACGTTPEVARVVPYEEDLLDWRLPQRVIEVATVADLAGAPFARIRNKVRNAAAAGVTAVPMSAVKYADLLEVVGRWTKQRSHIASYVSSMDFYGTLLSLWMDRRHSMDGVACLLGKSPVGFAVWDFGLGDTANLLGNLADISITGLAEFQLVEVSKRLSQRGIGRLNLGGSETRGLDQFKLKFCPSETIELVSGSVMFESEDA